MESVWNFYTESFPANVFDHFSIRKGRHTDSRVKLPIGNFRCLIDCVKSANFISWFLKTKCVSDTSKLVKRSIRVVKVTICYIDSEGSILSKKAVACPL